MAEFLFYRSETVDKYAYPSELVQSRVGATLKVLTAICGSVAKASAFKTSLNIDGFKAVVVYIPTSAP